MAARAIVEAVARYGKVVRVEIGRVWMIVKGKSEKLWSDTIKPLLENHFDTIIEYTWKRLKAVFDVFRKRQQEQADREAREELECVCDEFHQDLMSLQTELWEEPYKLDIWEEVKYLEDKMEDRMKAREEQLRKEQREMDMHEELLANTCPF